MRNSVCTWIARSRWRSAASRRTPGMRRPTTILGAALGLQASYVATVEGKLVAGFRAAERAYDEHEKALSLDPSRKDAALVVGTYRYVVSTLSLPMRVVAYVAGFGGGRERGIQMLRETAELDPESKPDRNPAGVAIQRGNDARADALFALILVYNRERRYDDALNVLAELQRLFPRNRLLWLEAGSTALRAGRAQQADALLNEGLAMMAKDKRPRMPGEEALWRYKRGAARAALGRTDDALADLNVAERNGFAELGSRPRPGGDRTPRAETRRSRQRGGGGETGGDIVRTRQRSGVYSGCAGAPEELEWPVRSKPGSGSLLRLSRSASSVSSRWPASASTSFRSTSRPDPSRPATRRATSIRSGAVRGAEAADRARSSTAHYLRSNADRKPPANPKPPESINVMAFDPDEGKIVRVSIPFWIVRMKMRGATIDLNGKHMNLEDLRLTAEDLERFGPTLIVDHQNTTGERVLVWSE